MPKRLLVLTLLSLTLLSLTVAACGGGREEAADAVATTDATVATTAPTVASTVAPTDAPTSAPDPTAAAAEAATPAANESAAPAGSAPLIFAIDPTQSEARFIVDEVLFGSPNTVTGVTNEISGTITINLDDPTQSMVGPIQVNARALATDNRFRNRSINRLILQSNRDEYQYITFTPTALEGLPSSAAAGDEFSFQIVGDLKIREIVQPVTFEVTVNADSETQLSGLAQATVQRADFELTIPNVDGVADVTEEVRLELEFVATASE